MEIRESLSISYLLHSGSRGWRVDYVARLFGPNLIGRVLSIMVPTHDAYDVRVWRSCCVQWVRVRDLYAMFCDIFVQRLDATWIWRMGVHPRVSLFLWKLAWDRLSIISILRGRGVALPITCPCYELKEEMVDHALFCC